MLLRQRVARRVCIRRDAFRAGNVDEGMVPCRMCFLGKGTNRFQFRFGIHETLVTAGDVVVNLDAKDARFLGVRYDLAGIVGGESVCADPHIVRPILFGCLGSSPWGCKDDKKK